MTKIQEQIQATILSKRSCTERDQLVYATEWLGYLPYGRYHWVDLNGADISNHFPEGWTFNDIDHLTENGLLKVIEDSRKSDEDTAFRIVYEVMDNL